MVDVDVKLFITSEVLTLLPKLLFKSYKSLLDYTFYIRYTLIIYNNDLGKKVNTSDVINNLTSTSTTKPLSAAQGKTLNDSLNTTNNKLDNAISNLSITRKVFYNASTSSYGIFDIGISSKSTVVICATNNNGYVLNPIAYKDKWVFLVHDSNDNIIKNTNIGEIYAFYYAKPKLITI